MRPRDFLKFGQLYLDHGVWNGQRVVPAAWVEESTNCQVVAEGACADGYDWHLNTVVSGGRRYREYEANGMGGQLLAVLPELDLAVVFTAANYNTHNVWRTFRDSYLAMDIIPAVTAGSRP
jgi:CubicO group peptidase (beta-lactamase class C family)